MSPSTRTSPIEIVVLLLGEDIEAGPVVGSGLLLESDILGDSLLLLETNDYILLEA